MDEKKSLTIGSSEYNLEIDVINNEFYITLYNDGFTNTCSLTYSFDKLNAYAIIDYLQEQLKEE